MALSPEEQAQAATRIGELEQRITEAGPEDRVRLREEANTLRAEIGLPLIIATPDPVDTTPSPQSPPGPASAGVRNGFFALLGAVIVVLFVLSRLNSSPTPDPHPLDYEPAPTSVLTSIPSAPKTASTIRYNIYGTAKSVSVTYQNGGGGTQQEADVRVPWEKTVRVSSGGFVYISAQNQSDTGTVTCTVYVDGLPVKNSSSNGAYTIATCSGRVP